MCIFGHYPGQDDFYLVVCSHCGQVVKPQAFEKHCERRHGPLAKVYARLRAPAPAPAPQPQQRARHGHGHSPSHAPSAPPAPAWEGRGAPGQGPPPPLSRAAPPSPSTPPQYRHAKSSKEGGRYAGTGSGWGRVHEQGQAVVRGGCWPPKRWFCVPAQMSS